MMRLVLASDFQAQVENLDLCSIAVDELLRTARDFKPDAIVLAGDLKEHYEPVSMFVVKFWVAIIGDMRRRGLRVIVLLGNHDRISQSSRSKNWLDVLRAAGAEIVTKPRWKTVGRGRVAFLPYTADAKKELRWARGLAEDGRGRGDVLVFHTGVSGASMGLIPGAGISPDDLIGCAPGTEHRTTPDTEDCGWAYEAAFGGHYHEHQKLKDYPIWYIGSPFCHSWSEVNQRKGHMTVEL